MSYDLKNFKVLGYTTDFGQCECCGKDNLKGTISILDLNSDVVLHFGTTCAAREDKYDTYEAFQKAKKDVRKSVSTFNDHVQFARSVARRIVGALENQELFDKIVNGYVAFACDSANMTKTGLPRYNWEQWGDLKPRRQML